MGERERHVRVEALETLQLARATDAEVERRAAVVAAPVARQRMADRPLQRVRHLDGRTQLRVGDDDGAPALDPTGGFDPRDSRDEVLAGEVVGRRERRAVSGVRLLLGHRGQAPRAADGDTPERTWRPADLPSDDIVVVVAVAVVVVHRAQRPAARRTAALCRARQPSMPLTM